MAAVPCWFYKFYLLPGQECTLKWTHHQHSFACFLCYIRDCDLDSPQFLCYSSFSVPGYLPQCLCPEIPTTASLWQLATASLLGHRVCRSQPLRFICPDCGSSLLVYISTFMRGNGFKTIFPPTPNFSAVLQQLLLSINHMLSQSTMVRT